MTVSITVRFAFDTLGAAAEGLLTVLADARGDDTRDYSFRGLTASQILLSGLQMQGDVADLAAKLEQVPGAIRHDE